MGAAKALSWDGEAVRGPGPKDFLHLQWVCKAFESPCEKEGCGEGSGKEPEESHKEDKKKALSLNGAIH